MINARNDDKVEVIAEKSRKKAYVYLALMTLGVVVALVGAILLIYVKTQKSEIWELCILIVGAVMIITFGGLFLSQLFRSYALVTLEEGKLKFSDGTTCAPHEISAVERGAASGNCGKITVTLNGTKIGIDGVVNPDKAYRKLCVLTGNTIIDKN